jgi:hypothetical protein
MNFLKATRGYLPDEVIINLGNKPTEKENPGRIQINEEKFILPPLDIYHSCKPNAYIDWDSMDLKAVGTVSEGTTVTYHYGTSEDDYRIGAFHCTCGDSDCIKYFQGFKYLSDGQRDKIKERVSPFLKEKYYSRNRL